MIKITAILLSTLLLTYGFVMSPDATAYTIKIEKQEMINKLEDLKNDTNNKKSKKNIESAIKQIEESLEDKFWSDDSTLKIKPGKKVLKADQNAMNKLDNILKDKKESKSIKNQILEINLRIAEMDKELVENTIANLEEIIMSEKGLKKLAKASNHFEKGEELLNEGKYVKANKYFEKAWDQIKKTLKDPHFKKLEIIELEGVGDMNFDGIPDVYLKVTEPSKPNKPKQVHMKITGECVNGEIHDDAAMKIGFSTQIIRSLEFFDDKVSATNKWFKKYDLNKKIEPVVISTVSEYFSFPISGEDLIQKNTENKFGSFEFNPNPISILGEQTGWEGNFEFEGEPGDYHLNFWFPLTEPTNQGDSCNFVSSFSIDTTINS
jgi:tetratricopeptide (TPR) repeat protein